MQADMQADRYDVLIIGGGIAGIATALDLLEGGKTVALLDRDAESAFGGLARESFGGMFFVDSPEQRRQGIRDSAELALSDWQSFAEFGSGDRWPRAWAEAYVRRCTADVYQWVRGFGVSFLPVVNWVERGEHRPGNSVPRFHVAWGTGKGLAEALIGALRGHRNVSRLTLRFNRRVERLSMRAGKIDGAEGVDEITGVPFEAKADRVVVAAGGINGGDLKRVRENWHRDWGKPPAELLSGSHRFADGRLHDATVAVGGVLTHLDKMWNYAAGVHHPRPRKLLHGLSLVPPRSALWLNWRGMRIGPQPLVSGFDTRRLVTDICAQERQYSWQLMNWRIALKELAISGAEHNPSIREKRKFGFLRDILFGNRWLVNEMIDHCKDFVTATTLPELVDKMNALQGDRAVELGAVADAVIVSLYLIATALSLCVVAPAKPHPSGDAAAAKDARSPLRDLKEGLAYVWSMPRMRAALWVAFLANVTAYPMTNGLLPYVARDIYGADQTGLGYLSASFAIGSLIGSMTLSLAGGVRVARLLIGTTVSWYAMLLVFAQIKTLSAAMACLMLAGISQSMSMISIAVILMRSASGPFRGRVMGVRMMVIYGLPLGLLAAGSLIDLMGFTATATVYAATGLTLMLAIATHWREDLWPLHAPANAR